MRFQARSFRITLLGIACCALTCSASAQKLYKHVDEKGVVTYSDRPATVGENKIAVDNTVPNGDRSESINNNMKKAYPEKTPVPVNTQRTVGPVAQQDLPERRVIGYTGVIIKRGEKKPSATHPPTAHPPAAHH
jgi:hypothetical protein